MARKKKLVEDEEEPLVEMKVIHIAPASKRVVGRLKKGHKVQIKQGDRPLHVFSTRHDAIMKAFLKGRGIHLALHPHEVKHNMGLGIFDSIGDWFKGAAETVGNAVVSAAETVGKEVVGAANKVGDFAVDVGKTINDVGGKYLDPNRNGVTRLLSDIGADIQNKVLNPISSGMSEFGSVMEKTVGPAIVNGIIDVAKEGGNLGLDAIKEYGGEIVGGALVALCAATGQVELMPLAAAAGAAVGKWAIGKGTERGKEEVSKFLDSQKMSMKKPSPDASAFEKATYNLTQKAVRMARDSLEDEIFKSDKYTQEQKDTIKSRREARKKKEEDEDKLLDQAAIEKVQREEKDDFEEEQELANKFEKENVSKAKEVQENRFKALEDQQKSIEEQRQKDKKQRLGKKDFIRLLNKYTGQRMNALETANREKAEADAMSARLAAESETRKKALIPKLDYSGAVSLSPYTDPVPISTNTNVGGGLKSHHNIQMPKKHDKKGKGFAEDVNNLSHDFSHVFGQGLGTGLYASNGRGVSRHAGLVGVGGNLLHSHHHGIPPALQSQAMSQNFQWKSRLPIAALIGKGQGLH